MVLPDMRNDLDELLERVEFCRQKSGELECKIAQLAESSISHWLSPWQPGTGEIRAKLLAHPPVSLRQEVGMIVNEQRAILDALACKLATRNHVNHTNDVYFPITKSKEGFFDKVGQSKIRKLAAEDKRIIEKLKPWLPREDNAEDGNAILFQLHDADRVRKHQDLLRWACIGGARPFGNGRIGQLNTGPVVFDEIGKEKVLAFFMNVTCQLNVRFEIVYSNPAAIDGYAVAPLLSRFNDTVGEIVASFA